MAKTTSTKATRSKPVTKARTGKPARRSAEAAASGGGDVVPADASDAAQAGFGAIQIGNRKFSAKATTLGTRKLDILPDMPDIRDRIYAPNLRPLLPGVYPRVAFTVRNQGADSSCTGFSLAHVIDVLRFRETGPDNPQRVSARMLYEMAKRNDEWDGSAYQGSSLRGAIKGFFRNGVCNEATAPDVPKGTEWVLTYDMAKEARETRLGAYFRLQPDITDYHAALNEVGVIYVSAQIHSNWQAPKDRQWIEPGGKPVGGHAFAIVGYDADGFWILNSWGAEWGANGIAHWHYADWASTVMDAWVLQLGVRSPTAFGAVPNATISSSAKGLHSRDPNRGDIIGHFINIDDGRLVMDGKYGSPTDAEMRQTVDRLTLDTSNSGKGYDHLVIYAHGGLNSLVDEAKRISVWARNDIFGRNKLYNFHLMWGSGFIDEVFGKISQSHVAGRAGGVFDWMFEAGPGREIGAYAWRNMKQDAAVSFDGSADYDGGYKGLGPLLKGIDAARHHRPTLHLVGHSAGSIVLGHLLGAMNRFKPKNIKLGSIHLMAPACTVDFFNQQYGPYLSGNGALKVEDKIYLYSMTDAQESADTVSADVPLLPSYSHSLLYLVSRAYEDLIPMPIAGMAKYDPGLKKSAKLDISYSARGGACESTSHGGFDNDVATLTTIMNRIAGHKVPSPPVRDELTGY
jgi:hypothetical protein